jgi:hypothetical protein
LALVRIRGMDRNERALRDLAALLRQHKPEPTPLQLDEMKRGVVRRREHTMPGGSFSHRARTVRRTATALAAFLAIGGGSALAVKTAGGSKSTTSSASTQYNTGGQGCTPGYWKNNTAGWTTYKPTDSFNAVFGVNYDPSLTLGGALNLGGGGFAALARHAAAALLNAANVDVNYGAEESEIKALVQQAFATNNPEPTKNTFDQLNNAGCSIDAHGRPIRR